MTQPRIAVLSPALASQIAAGEVVERPASVVKELIENAVDAGASRCDVAIEGGGILLLSVSDDGHGMSPQDARLAVERHATSKLREIDDLNQLGSYGFRGEALPSIASVSRLSIVTRTAEHDAGTEVLVEAGGEPVVRPKGSAIGTKVQVTDLFFNVPARRKFLRASGTEAGHVTEVLEAAALAHPELSVTLVRDGRKVREWLRVTSRAERVAQVLNDDGLIVCAGKRGPLGLEAFLSRPERARQGAAGLRILVNGRPVRDRAIAATVAQAYGSVLERGRYPRGAVYLELPPSLVDVNVHPQKAEVRFADPRALTEAVYSLVSRPLSQALSLPPTSSKSWTAGKPPVAAPERAPSFSWQRPGSPPGRTNAGEAGLSAGQTPALSQPAAPQSSALEPALPQPSLTQPSLPQPSPAQPALSESAPSQGSSEPKSAPVPDFPAAAALSALPSSPSLPLRDGAPHAARGIRWSSLRFLVQVRQMFLICEASDGIYVLDQHAAAERVTFAKLRRQFQEQSIASQSLLFPVVIELEGHEIELCEEHLEQITRVGLDVQLRGTDRVSIHAVPKLLQRGSPERLLRDLLSEIARTGGRAFSDAIDKALATMACHAALRAGDPLTEAEATALLEALDDADFAGYCPHGRPIVATMTFAELERKVGRR